MIESIFCENKMVSDEILQQTMQRITEGLQSEGGLGRLEEIMVKLAAHQDTTEPSIKKAKIAIFAADHGISENEVSEYPNEQLTFWIDSLKNKRLPVSSMAAFSNSKVELIDVGLRDTFESGDCLTVQKISTGTEDFCKAPAMAAEQLFEAMSIGITTAEAAKQEGMDLFIGGDIGLANTVSAIAMISVLSGTDAEELLMLGRARLMRSEQAKLDLIRQAIALHKDELTSPLKVLQHLGGFETAALVGAYIRCAQLGITIVVDGLMATVAAWIADLVSRNDQLLHCKSNEMLMDLGKYSVPETMFCICGNCPRLVEWCFFAHQSTVASHKLVLEILAVDPLLQFDMKQGQATGGVLVIPILQQACSVLKSFSTETE